ncbi:hypothetical protein PVAP13_8NG243800 [Panicum virgatum]|uniref:Uncharacterized protein n=1 Tax=Panicum virgatum TaxID=38727 RepID=A0A8T0P510_PANVG|nr:hypothetical protein PVAP13_8NG243800 [Panicum virgatum]
MATMQESAGRVGSSGPRSAARSATLKTPLSAHHLLLTRWSGEGLQASSNSIATSSPRGGVGNNAAHFLWPCIPSRREVGTSHHHPPTPIISSYGCHRSSCSCDHDVAQRIEHQIDVEDQM